jgi:ABC-type amino acid transport substrate-binding protein
LGLEHVWLDVNRDDIRFLAIGDAAVLTQALEDGRVDAALVDMIFSRRLHDKGFSILAELKVQYSDREPRRRRAQFLHSTKSPNY